MRRKLILSLILSGLFLSSASLTFAYLTDEKAALNEISPTDDQIHIDEKFDPPDEIEPGSVITKAPRIVNDSEIGVYVRMAVHFSDSSAEALCEPFRINPGWQLHTDGYYYYSHPLDAGEQTTALFDMVKIKDTVAVEDLIPFDILVYAESVQTEGYDSADSAWKFFTGGSV